MKKNFKKNQNFKEGIEVVAPKCYVVCRCIMAKIPKEKFGSHGSHIGGMWQGQLCFFNEYLI